MKNKTAKLFNSIAKTLRPTPNMTVSDWADRYRIISAEGASEPGRWRTDRAPYQRAIMDAFTEHGVWKVVVKSCSQIGKSDIMNNVLGRFAHLAPAPMLLIQPTIEMAEDFSKKRIAPMIRDTKELKAIFRDTKSRNTGNTILSKQFPGGYLAIGGANSPAGLASRPIKVLLADEIDRFPDSAGSEGDPIDLASKRMTTFWDRIMGEFSTPTNAGSSRIEDEYMEGTQEEWRHQCPSCGEWELITHRHITADYDSYKDAKGKKHVNVKSVTWHCPDCGHEFSETQMRQASQKYVAQNPEAKAKGVRSFFVNCWSSPWLTWAEPMQEWLEAKGDPEREKVIYNTRFGEAYEAKGNFEGPEQFLERREDYKAELPDGVLLLTAAVDVQDNRLEYEICGWGLAEERWGISKGIILGVPDTKDVWLQLDAQLDREYKFASGTGLLVARTFIDSGGHYTKEVYAYCMARMARQRFAVKGASTPGVPVIHKYTKQTVAGGRTIPVVLLGTDSGKQYIMDRLSIEVPGSKYMHFPLDTEQSAIKDSQQLDGGLDLANLPTEIMQSRGYDEIYFKGLISETKVARKKNGRLVYQWENIAKDKRNEPLDLAVYNLAAMKSLRVDWEQLQEAVTGIKSKTRPAKATQNHSNNRNKAQSSAKIATKTGNKAAAYGKIKKMNWE